SRYVGREQVGRELKPLVVDAEDVGERFRQRGFGDAGHAFEQDVTRGKEGDKELVRDLLHAHDDAADFLERPLAHADELSRKLTSGEAARAGIRPMVRTVDPSAGQGGACRGCHEVAWVWKRRVPSARAARSSSSWATRWANEAGAIRSGFES